MSVTSRAVVNQGIGRVIMHGDVDVSKRNGLKVSRNPIKCSAVKVLRGGGGGSKVKRSGLTMLWELIEIFCLDFQKTVKSNR